MDERLDDLFRMFPVLHPDYINTFERVHGAGIEQRQVLRSLSEADAGFNGATSPP